MMQNFQYATGISSLPQRFARSSGRLLLGGMALLFSSGWEASAQATADAPASQQLQADEPGIWIEGENPSMHNFYTGKVVRVAPTGPSAGMFLRLQASTSNQNHPKPPFFATYRFQVPAAGTYHFWLGGSPQNAPWASSMRWRVDNGEPVSLEGKAWTGASYGFRGDEWAKWIFGWTQAGAIALEAGEHELKIEVSEPAANGKSFFALIDALLLTTDPSFVPSGNHPQYSTEPTWEERMKTTTQDDLGRQLTYQVYKEQIRQTNEEVSDETAAMVLKKIASRPLPTAADRARETTEFGLHGMERPYIVVGRNADSPEIARAYDLLARAGVDNFRTADSCWHRLSGTRTKDKKKLHLNFDDLDFQTASAWKYGITHLFTVGYPPSALTVSGDFRAACRPELYPLYREYLETMFARYKDVGMAYVELANEVDAPGVWWRGSTASQYVQEMKLTYEAMKKVAPEAKSVAFASTYSRDEDHGGPKGGRRFVAKCFDLGIDRYADAYALHHLSSLKAKDFPAFFRRELVRANAPASPGKKLFNTEQNGGGPYPYDLIKAFARSFFLYDMPQMDYFLARDFFENGNMKAWGLFDFDWRPKPRLLAYAFAVDAMRGRELVGIAQPAPGIEAYVLKRIGTYKGSPATPGTGTQYAIVLWKTDRETLALADKAPIPPVEVGHGFKEVRTAFDWKIDPIAFSASAPAFSVGDQPIGIYTDALPDWNLLTREQYLESIEAGQTDAPLPTSQP